MKLKEYQEHALKEVKGFLEQLAAWRPEAFRRDQWLFDFAEKGRLSERVGKTIKWVVGGELSGYDVIRNFR